MLKSTRNISARYLLSFDTAGLKNTYEQIKRDYREEEYKTMKVGVMVYPLDSNRSKRDWNKIPAIHVRSAVPYLYISYDAPLLEKSKMLGSSKQNRNNS